jgi:hypothetical protein
MWKSKKTGDTFPCILEQTQEGLVLVGDPDRPTAIPDWLFYSEYEDVPDEAAPFLALGKSDDLSSDAQNGPDSQTGPDSVTDPA